ncbi:UNVERIFIED_CONTAM: hypothetical protein PYX00_008873 [Menopon gallinae]|uniref:Guided entry of tail-anchored proteins factor 1 n=1 Tax=Menopon gallinae TaxID=328185 RepID=A0AAW2H951_9NEOP
MFLFAVVTLLTFVNSFAPKIASFVIGLIPDDTSVQTITSDIVKLKKELCSIRITDEFPKHARLQRRINKLQKERKKLMAEKDAKLHKVRNTFLFATYGITSVCLSCLVWMYKGESVAHLPAEWLWPAPNIFNWFSDNPGCISIPSWIIMTCTASRVIAKSF